MLDREHLAIKTLLEICEEPHGDDIKLTGFQQRLGHHTIGLIETGRPLHDRKCDVMHIANTIQVLCGVDQHPAAYRLVTPAFGVLNACRMDADQPEELRMTAFNCASDVVRKTFVVPHVSDAKVLAGTGFLNSSPKFGVDKKTARAVGLWLELYGETDQAPLLRRMIEMKHNKALGTSAADLYSGLLQRTSIPTVARP